MSVLHDRLAMQNQTIEELKSQRDQARDALDDIRDACRREGATMTPSEVSQLAVERIATLEADLAASRERETALAAALDRFGPCPHCGGYGTEQTLAGCDMEGNAVSAESPCPCGGVDPSAILAAHNAEVGRKAKVEALEQLIGAMVEPDHISLEYIQWRIAALQAEGGKG